jgi:hypothetical protein
MHAELGVGKRQQTECHDRPAEKCQREGRDMAPLARARIMLAACAVATALKPAIAIAVGNRPAGTPDDRVMLPIVL